VDPAELTARVLALVLDRSPRTVIELETAAAASADSVRTALDALERNGLVEWDPRPPTRTHVRPGPRYTRRGPDLAELAEPAMRRLAAESGETVNLMVRTAGGAEAIAQVDGRHVLGVSNWIGREVPDHCSAAGKVFLAFGASTLPSGELERATNRTITDRPLLERELETVRRQGFATIVDELELGLAAVAAPVRDAEGVVAALSVAGPTARLGAARLALMGRVAIEQAHAVSVQLGYEGELEDLLDSLRARRE
jgi:DNA-binding IclR family transcriptional regulator